MNSFLRGMGFISMGIIKHKRSRTPVHNVWWSMISRCTYPTDTNYTRYGGRGIKICERWRGSNGFNNFIEDMGDRPSKKHSIDRIDVNGDYSPSNCKWSLKIDQANNTRSNVFVEFNGETKTISQWGRQYSIRPGLIKERLGYGWPIDKIFSVPPTPGRKNLGKSQ